MSEIQFTINIKAPELVDALKELTRAFAGAPSKLAVQDVQEPSKGSKAPKKEPEKAKEKVAEPKVEAPVQAPEEAVKEEVVKEPKEEAPKVKTYTLSDLAEAGASLINVGKQSALKTLLQSYGVKALPALPKDRYNDFADGLRELGAKI